MYLARNQSKSYVKCTSCMSFVLEWRTQLYCRYRAIWNATLESTKAQVKSYHRAQKNTHCIVLPGNLTLVKCFIHCIIFRLSVTPIDRFAEQLHNSNIGLANHCNSIHIHPQTKTNIHTALVYIIRLLQYNLNCAVLQKHTSSSSYLKTNINFMYVHTTTMQCELCVLLTCLYFSTNYFTSNTYFICRYNFYSTNYIITIIDIIYKLLRMR